MVTWNEIGTAVLVWALASPLVCVVVGRAITIADQRAPGRGGPRTASAGVAFVPSQASPEDVLAGAAVADRTVLEPLQV